jgi:hypothetical protein
VGYKCAPRHDADELVNAPAPPKSYTKQETIDKWLEEKTAEFCAESAELKITGQITHIFAVDLRNGRIFDSEPVVRDMAHEADCEPLGCHFARWLLDGDGEYRNEFPDRHCGGDPGVAFYGFNLKPFLRVLGVECNTAGFEVPLGLWYANGAVLDPYDMLVENDHGGRLLSTLDVHQLAEMLGDRTFSTQRAAGESESAAEEGVDDADEDGVAEAPPASRKKKTRRKKATA